MPPREPLFTPRFFLMCGFSFTVFLSAFQLLPTAPYRILELGGGEVAAGMFLGFLTYASALSAPITGSLADRVGKRRMLITCSLVLAVFAVGYAVTRDHRVLLALALLHGCFWSGLLSSSSAYITDFIPAARRSEGIGYWGLSTIFAIAFAPSLGFWLYHRGGWMWLCASVGILNLVMAGIAFQLVELPRPRPATAFFGRHLVEWRVLALSMTLFLYSFGYGAITSFAALYADANHVVPKEVFFTTFAVVVLATRPFLGPLGDRIGHRRVFIPCLVLITCGLGLLAASGTRPGIILAAAVFGTGFGAAYPAFAAYALRQVDPARRGAAFGSILAAFDTGIGTGSIVSGWIVHRHGFSAAFAVAAVLSAFAIPFFLYMDRRLLLFRPGPANVIQMRWVIVFAVGVLACGSSAPTPVAPEPSPLPEPSAIVRGCGLPAGGPFQRCPRVLPFFNFELNEAIAQVENEVPEIFDFADSQGGLSYRVLDRRRYHEEVVARLEAMGFCALWDGEEVGVKTTNDFNEQYQVMTSLGYVRWGGGSYRSTCFPASF